MLGIMEKENKEIDLTDAHRKIVASLLMLYIPNKNIKEKYVVLQAKR